jgi:ferredoxin-NADP reductase
VSQVTTNRIADRTLGLVSSVLNSRVAAVLTYPHGVDRYLEQFAPTWSLREVRAEVIAVRHQTADSVTMTLRPNRNWQGFRAGQYVRLTVEINGVRRTRCYSPANSVHTKDGLIELTAKAHSGGFVSRHLQQNLRPGMTVGLSQAEGQFALPEQRPERILLISGGSGITPVMSMLRTLCDEGHAGRITFLHYSNAAQDQIYAGELAAIAARYPNVELLRAYAIAGQGGELQGYFSLEQLAKAVPDYADAQAFLCGPPAMMKVVQQVWAAAGLSERLHLEHFTAAPVVIDSANAEGEVRFARSERLAVNSGATLLDQAEAAGLKPESGCRMGICKACTCRKTAGKVRDTRTGEISDGGEQDIQICISVPVGSVTLDI